MILDPLPENKKYIIILILVTIVSSVFIQTEGQASELLLYSSEGEYISKSEENKSVGDRASSSQSFSVGERLVYKIRYGIIKAGRAEMKVMSLTEEGNDLVYHIQTTAKSLPTFNWIYKVEDVVNTFASVNELLPIRFEKKLREGGYKADTFVDYHHDDSLAVVEFIRYEDNMKIKGRKKYNVIIPPKVYDVLSAFYYVRTLPLEIGKSVFLSNHDKDKVFNTEIKVYQKEEVKVEAGKFRCLVVEPVLQGEGIFKQKGRLKIWLTDDELKIPVLMTSEIIVGHVTTELAEIHGINQLIPAQIK